MFLDRCDLCHKPKKCKGYENYILCDECIEKLKKDDGFLIYIKNADRKEQMTLDDYLK